MLSNTQLKITNKAPTVLVLGGYGFIGRYTVAALNSYGIKTIIGSRRASTEAMTNRQIKLHQSICQKAWQPHLEGIDAVINTVGILRERKGESYDKVHHLAVAVLSRECNKRNIPLVHVSAIGINNLQNNEFAKSKLRGELAIQDSGCRGAIIRASIVNAPDGYGSGWMYRVAKWPLWLIPAGATKLLCPIEAKDLGEALAKLVISQLQFKDQKLEVLEVGGAEILTLKDYLQKLRAQQKCLPITPVLTIKIPRVIAKFFAKLFDIFHLTPYSIGHHELLESDNIPNINVLTQILGRGPNIVGNDLEQLDATRTSHITKPVNV